jgi:hypothetical protein
VSDLLLQGCIPKACLLLQPLDLPEAKHSCDMHMHCLMLGLGNPGDASTSLPAVMPVHHNLQQAEKTCHLRRSGQGQQVRETGRAMLGM